MEEVMYYVVREKKTTKIILVTSNRDFAYEKAETLSSPSEEIQVPENLPFLQPPKIESRECEVLMMTGSGLFQYFIDSINRL
jgi:hypothetical protein